MCITWNTILTMRPIVGRYGDPHWRSQARHEIYYLEHTGWIFKDIRRRIHNLTWFYPNLTYIHGERTWESFINKLDTKSFNLPLDNTRVFTFSLNLRLYYKSMPSLYAPSPWSSLSWLFRVIHCYSPQLSSVILFQLNLKLQPFIYKIFEYNFYLEYEMILTIGCLKNLDQSY